MVAVPTTSPSLIETVIGLVGVVPSRSEPSNSILFEPSPTTVILSLLFTEVTCEKSKSRTASAIPPLPLSNCKVRLAEFIFAPLII